ncbi:MAG: UDP-N-acetylmuramate dehydrogenase [Lachnospiraceae bacterium]|nr:UDP-N-acetylmuramate dehydrogenase [Lachnospiraceae bacterium]
MARNNFFVDYLKTVMEEDRILLDEPMSNHTTFRVGGPADYFLKPATIGELKSLIRYLNQTDRRYMVIGNGSNLLVGDHGYRGVVVQLLELCNDIDVNGDTIMAGAGAKLSEVAQIAAEEGLSGLEFASGIPGSIGGAVVMNAGAYDGEMKQVVESVEVVTPLGDFFALSNEEMKFGYRMSVVQKARYTVARVVIRLQRGDTQDIKKKMRELSEERRKKQPLNYPSAGSTFKRPEGYFAGKLIMDAGMSGFAVGGAKVSEKHCGFIVNTGWASAADILDLIKEVQEKVKTRFGVQLEPEVCIIGEF